MRHIHYNACKNGSHVLIILVILIPRIVLSLVSAAAEGDYCEEEFDSIRCNPLLDKQCLVTNEALRSSIFESFTMGTKYFAITSCRRGVKFDSNGMSLTLSKPFDNPSLVSSFYIMYGKVEADIKGAKGKGIISSFYLQSDDLDEIDIAEIFGGDPYEFQTNYFIKGNVSNYDRGKYHQLPGSPLDKFYRYGVEWTPDNIILTIDGKIVRSINSKNKYGFPSSPMSLKFSLWAGGDASNNAGTIAWAGGKTDYSKAPFMMLVKNVKVADYSTGESYTYGNLPGGKWVDLQAKNGKIFGEDRIKHTITTKATITRTSTIKPKFTKTSTIRPTSKITITRTSTIRPSISTRTTKVPPQTVGSTITRTIVRTLPVARMAAKATTPSKRTRPFHQKLLPKYPATRKITITKGIYETPVSKSVGPTQFMIAAHTSSAKVGTSGYYSISTLNSTYGRPLAINTTSSNENKSSSLHNQNQSGGNKRIFVQFDMDMLGGGSQFLSLSLLTIIVTNLIVILVSL
ncbi:uncharacterized protein J8A68_005581 [[Candida] subhashii]|uniref:GH16 domain-containing protein n=1 Tax=[Candida] subhashii TaxID=561895 RepID=A0A8J5Q5Z2_9ASCO|nr:uncharacterized protein J8A68_005581 [[Candida] subhashii]KAG7660906.1 hypothetical protein J8A68_005581 [[Candida] subhashii]